MQLENKYLVLNKREWQMERELKVLGFCWTDEEIDNADDKGLIGTKFGIDCYVTRHILSNNKSI